MIPAIIYLILRRYRKTNPVKTAQLLQLFRTARKFILLFVLLLLAGLIALSQPTQLRYTINRKGNQVGSISFFQQVVGTKKIFRTESEVKTRIIFLFTAIGREEAIYENGVLLSSSVYQKLNGDVRLDNKTRLVGRNYVVYNGKHPETLNNYPISYNMICLFGIEPAEITAMAAEFRALAVAPKRRDLIWRYGVASEIMDPIRRTTEIGNWLASVVESRRLVA